MAQSNGNHKKTVAIVGAGLAGLLTAHGLKQNGFEAVVFERDASMEDRTRDWTMLVHWAMPVFAKLLPEDILADLPQAICNPHLEFNAEVESLPCYNGVTGDILFRSPTPGARRVLRQALRTLLARHVDIRWAKELKQVSERDGGVQLEFGDGDTFDADMVLGTDGSSSKVRELLLGAEAARSRGSKFMFATGINKFDDAEKTKAIMQAHPVASLMMGTSSVGALGLMSAESPDDPATWTTFWVKIWRDESAPQLRGQEALDYIKEKTSPLQGAFQSAIDWTPATSSVSIDEMKYWVPVPWDNRTGLVTLAGDSAHPMLIYRGQGFQHSITDVAKYVDSLVQLREAGWDAEARARLIGDYDSEMIERGAKAVQQSLQEAEKSLDLETIGKMLMVTKGHGAST